MSDSPALLIGERIVDDELVKLSLMREGWIVSRQVPEYAASPKLEAFWAAQKPAPPKARKGRGTVLRLVPNEGAGGRS